ncbi:MAG TPA: LamG-like jellyroll fold domain-containing protein [Candidatus Limnocylindrales bacterium]|nr:LamG-like jellyroll fold domain-containing protein [Candidatus Limnocylindrales bacterium]
MKMQIIPMAILCLAISSNADLVHRYSFNDSSGSTTAADSVGGSSWSATLNGSAALDGSQLVLDGSIGTFAELPGGIITNATAVTIEAWASFGTQLGDWARLFNFGSLGDSGNVLTDFRLVPRAPGNYVDLFFGTQASSAYANHPQSLDNQTNVHVVVVLDPASGTLAAYTNGVLITGSPSAALPPLSGFTNQVSYLGKSFYAPDPFLVASIDEFRVWNQALSRPAIEASFESGPNNVSTNPGALQSIQLTVAQSELAVGLSQTANVSGQYASLTNSVTLNGLAGITYASGDTNVLTVSSAGLIQSVAVGATTVRATYQGLSATQTVTVVPNLLAPSHRYRFNDTPGSTTAVDSIGGAAWNGTLFGNAVLNGTQLVLDGSDGTYLGLPAQIIGNGTALTIEAWASFGVQLRDWSRLFSFGNVDGANINEQFRLSPRAGGNWVDLNYLGAYANHPQGWDNQTNLHIVAVLNPPSGFLGIYANGVLIGRTGNATTPLSPALDQLSYVGRSLYPADPYLIGTINEFRIYDGALSPDRIAVDTAAGPDNLVTNAGPLQSATLVMSPQLKLGETQHAFFAGNFANVSNVDLFLYGSPTATSSDTNVATIDSTGLVRAIAAGTANISAQFGTFHSSAQVTVAPAVLTHRYSFNDPTSSTTVSDAVAGASGVGTLNGSAQLDGTNLVLDGVNGYVQLPTRIISGYSAVSFEAWASFSANAQWVRLWDFGDQNGGGGGNSSIYFTPHNGSDGLNLTMFKPGFGSDVGLSTNLDNVPEMQIVGVYTDKEMDLYFNGTLVGRNTNVQLAVTDNIDVNSFIGKSMFNPDPYLNGTVDEFRIYQGALTPGQVGSDYAAGPNALPAPAPSLAIKLEAGIVTISWPTNAGRYILATTTNLASPFSFSNFNPIEQNGQIVVTDSVTNQAKFYRLQLGP